MWAVMTVHKLTAGDGYQYLIRQVAALDDTHRGKGALGDYYSSKGETPGRWGGSGLAALGGLAGSGEADPWTVEADSVVTEMQMKALFGLGLHPNHEAILSHLADAGVGGARAERAARLGRKFYIYDEHNEFFNNLKLAYARHNAAAGLHPFAAIGDEIKAAIRTTVATTMFTAQHGREPADDRELSGFVARNSRPKTTAVAGFDLVFTPVKSVSALWAIAPRELAEQLQGAHDAAVAETLAWLERNAGFSRMGANGLSQVDTEGLIFALFNHRDSRGGDPNMHTHVVVSNKVPVRGDDGRIRWLALDAKVLYQMNVAASEFYNTAIERHCVRLGLSFHDVDKGPGKRRVREIVGVAPELNRHFSSRREAIVGRVDVLSAAFQRAHGREPTTVEYFALSQKATTETRQGKHAPRSLEQQRAGWFRRGVQVLGGARELAAMVAGATVGVPRRAVILTDDLVEAAAAAAVAAVSAKRATWGMHHVRAEAERQLRYLDCYDDPANAADRVTARALQVHSVQVSGPVDAELGEPVLLRRRDGASVYTRHGQEVFSSEAVLAAERRILTAADLGGGFVVDETSLGLALVEAHAQGRTLNDGQHALIRDMATSGARVQLALAPAGTGKTTAMSALASAWRAAGGTVIGLAPTAAAAEVLATDLGADTDTIAKLVQLADPDPAWPVAADDPARVWFDRIGPDTLILVDEVGRASTAELDAVISYALRVGADVRGVGDDLQLASPSASGVVRDIAARHRLLTLSEVVRFGDSDRGKAEGAASLALRAGDPAGIAFYLDHHRVHISSDAVAADTAYLAWRSDVLAGRDSVLLAPTNDLVAELNERARADLLRIGTVAAGRTVTLGDGLRASVGDVVTTRENDRNLRADDRTWVKNGNRWTVKSVGEDGSLKVVPVRGDTAAEVTLTPRYVAAHTTLGYAATIDSRQGITADTCHTVGSDRLTRQQFYVAMTRGMQENHVYYSTAEADPHRILTEKATHPPTAVDILTAILRRDGAQVSAHTEIARTADPVLRLGPAASMYTDALYRTATALAGPTTMARIDAAAVAIDPEIEDCGGWPVLRGHLALLAADGHDPQQALTHAVGSGELGDALDVAAVLSWRLPIPDGTDAAGPLPWLAPIPEALARDRTWGPYLVRRAQRCVDLAAEVRAAAAAWTAQDVPAWGRAIMDRPADLAGVAVFRAAHSVEAQDSRITGGPQFVGRSARAQRALLDHLDATVDLAAPAPARWRDAAEALSPRITDDLYWPKLATHLDDAARAGADVKGLLAAAMESGGPLPDEMPAAALLSRLTGSLAPATLDTANTGLRPAWTPELRRILGGPVADIVMADPAWPSLVAAVAASDWRPADLLEAAGEHLRDLTEAGQVRPDQYARLLALRVQLLTADATSMFRDVPHGWDAPEAAESSAPEPPGEQIWAEEPPEPDDYLYGYDAEVDEDLGGLDFADLARERPATADLDGTLADLRVRRDAARRDVEALTAAIFRGAGGPAEVAAADELADLHRRHTAQRPLQHGLAHAHADWVAAEHTRDTRHQTVGTLDRQITAAHARGDDELAARYGAQRAELAQHTAAVEAAAEAARAECDTAHAALMDFAGGPDGLVSEATVAARRRNALDADIAALAQARLAARELDNQVRRVEARAARVADHQPAVDLDVAAELASMRAEIDLVERAGTRSPAAVYADAPDAALAGLTTQARGAVGQITGSAMSVQALRVHGGEEKADAVAAIALAAHYDGHRVLALPASAAATARAAERRYAHATADCAAAIANMRSGRWAPPPGSLLIIDDADHLDADQLRWLVTHAGATNTKLLLVTDDTAAAGHSRALTDAVADTLSWSARLGGAGQDTSASALARMSRYLDDLPDTAAHHDAADLLAHRGALAERYRDLATPVWARTAHVAHPSTDRGLGL